MKQIIGRKDVENIARLARLQLDNESLDQAVKDLENVLEHFALIQQVDTTEVKVSDDVTGKKNVMREDIVESEQLCTDQKLLDLAPDRMERQFKVKAVFED